jgi:UDP-3-O-[3-hydroxymyristoyl] glucosamine N-acyltransferase
MIQAKSGVLRSFGSDLSLMGYPAIKYRDYNKSYVHFKNLPKIMSKLNDLFKKTI